MKSRQSQSGSILCPLRAAADIVPDAAVISGAHRSISYAELDCIVSSVKTRLLEAGCGPGMRIGIYLPRDERYIVLLLALLRAGCVVCPLSTRIPSGGVSQLLLRAGISTLISEDTELLEKTSPEVRGLRPETLLPVEADGGDTGSAYLRLERPATIVFTSGSTGSPKGALHTLGNHYYSALGSNANIALSSGDRWLLSLPLYHVGGLSVLFRCLLVGATISLPEPGVPIGKSIEELGITHVSLVATQLRRLLEEKTETGNLKAVLLGGGPAPGSLLQEALVGGIPVHNSYGLTETASQATATAHCATPEELGSSGRVLKHREVSISGEGEILVRGETLFAGYVEDGALNLPLDPKGWFHTGDLGEFGDGENLHVRGRMDNLFISGGENIQPEEIEAELGRIDDVERAIVAPVLDEEFGYRPVSFVRMAGGEKVPEDLAGKLEETLPRFKVPVAFYGWPEDADAGGMKPDRGFFLQRASLLYRET